MRYVIGERMDCSGMRWRQDKAEAIRHWRCLEVNSLWDHFFAWRQDRWCKQIDNKPAVPIRTDQPLELSQAA